MIYGAKSNLIFLQCRGQGTASSKFRKGYHFCEIDVMHQFLKRNVFIFFLKRQILGLQIRSEKRFARYSS